MCRQFFLQREPCRYPVNAVLDLLGLGEVSERTKMALVASQTEPERLITTALCAPEYLVSV